MSEEKSRYKTAGARSVSSENGPYSPAFHAAAELIGKRWNGAIIYSLFNGLIRFSGLKGAIPGLSERLKDLEANGLVTRIVIPDTPVCVEYHLTEKALALRDVLIAINTWAQEWHDGD